jgi:hypothetical protein
MKPLARALSIALLVLAGRGTALAAAPPHCSQETLYVRGTPVTIGYCVAGPLGAIGPEELTVPVVEQYGSPAGAFSRARHLRFFAGASRAMESVNLARVGLGGTLHLTLVYEGGVVHIEGALLTPGAITIK